MSIAYLVSNIAVKCLNFLKDLLNNINFCNVLKLQLGQKLLSSASSEQKVIKVCQCKESVSQDYLFILIFFIRK
jgi:hypothetical protein